MDDGRGLEASSASAPGPPALPALPAPLMVIRRLSVDGEPLVKVGDMVGADDPLLAMSTFPGRVLHDDVARELRVAPAETERCLIHSPGTMVRPGQVIGRSSMFWQHRLKRAAHEGSIAGASPSLGVIYVREHLPTQLAETVRLDIVGELRGDKYDFHSYVRVKEGDKVERGQVLATRQEGGKFYNVTSPVFGTVTAVAPLMGSMNIMPDNVSSVLPAHVPGLVAAIRGGREVDVVGFGIVVEGLLGIGGEARGPLVAGPNDLSPWRAAASGADLSGAVLVTGCVDHRSLVEASERGVTGVIAGRARQKQVCLFLGRELGVIATGDENVSPVLILTGGFGEGRMDPALYARLAGLSGKLASLSGATHIRAGVIRPRIIVSYPFPPDFSLTEATAAAVAAGGAARPDGDEGSGQGGREPGVGARVRIVRGRWSGRTGTIRDLPDQPQEIPTGTSVLVAHVSLDPGHDDENGAIRVTVPKANLKAEEHGR